MTILKSIYFLVVQKQTIKLNQKRKSFTCYFKDPTVPSSHRNPSVLLLVSHVFLTLDEVFENPYYVTVCFFMNFDHNFLFWKRQCLHDEVLDADEHSVKHL